MHPINCCIDVHVCQIVKVIAKESSQETSRRLFFLFKQLGKITGTQWKNKSKKVIFFSFFRLTFSNTTNKKRRTITSCRTILFFQSHTPKRKEKKENWRYFHCTKHFFFHHRFSWKGGIKWNCYQISCPSLCSKWLNFHIQGAIESIYFVLEY